MSSFLKVRIAFDVLLEHDWLRNTSSLSFMSLWKVRCWEGKRHIFCQKRRITTAEKRVLMSKAKILVVQLVTVPLWRNCFLLVSEGGIWCDSLNLTWRSNSYMRFQFGLSIELCMRAFEFAAVVLECEVIDLIWICCSGTWVWGHRFDLNLLQWYLSVRS